MARLRYAPASVKVQRYSIQSDTWIHGGAMAYSSCFLAWGSQVWHVYPVINTMADDSYFSQDMDIQQHRWKYLRSHNVTCYW